MPRAAQVGLMRLSEQLRERAKVLLGDEGGEATGLRECPSSPWCMQNDADHNVTRMNLGHAPTQVAPPRFLVTRAVAPRFAVN